MNNSLRCQAINVLFLDIDDVLNNERSMPESGGRRLKTGTGYVSFKGIMFPSMLDNCCVDLLNDFVSSNDCAVVLSSTWRKRCALGLTSDYFQEVCGFGFPLLGATGVFGTRGEEIKRWREAHNDTRPFVILDDGSDMDPYMSHLVKVDGTCGLQECDVQTAEIMLVDANEGDEK